MQYSRHKQWDCNTCRTSLPPILHCFQTSSDACIKYSKHYTKWIMSDDAFLFNIVFAPSITKLAWQKTLLKDEHEAVNESSIDLLLPFIIWLLDEDWLRCYVSIIFWIITLFKGIILIILEKNSTQSSQTLQYPEVPSQLYRFTKSVWIFQLYVQLLWFI